MMRQVSFLLGLSLCAASCLATAHAAIRCDDLRPLPPQNTDQTYTGKLNAAVDGWFAKIAKVGGGAEGTYRDVSHYVLPEFPQADRLYVWERVIYLKCELIADSQDLSTNEKLHAVDQLATEFNSSPPPTSAPPSNRIDNNGNNNTIIQGNGNTVGKP